MPMTTDNWVRRVNALARHADEIARTMHPSAWPELMQPYHEQFRTLAGARTFDPSIQLTLELGDGNGDG